MAELRSPRVAIIGSGMSGVCMGATLRRAGIDSFRIFEKAQHLGGTWRENTYPGLTCDVPSHFYQFTFARNPDWTHYFSDGAEIWRYFDSVADRFDLKRHITFGAEVTSAEWGDGQWTLHLSTGESETFDFVVAGTGILHHPRYPEIAGLDTFAGAMFHSARWDHTVPLDGRRIGVVGTGSTGAQIVTALAETAGHLSMFQRTAQWIVPMGNPAIPSAARGILRHVPGANALMYKANQVLFEELTRGLIEPGVSRAIIGQLVRRNLDTVRDPHLRAKLTPDYEPGCKRMIISGGFYPAIQRSNVSLVTDRITRVEPGGVRTDDGVLHELDVLVLATGFDAHAYVRPMKMVGVGGVTLEEAWADGPRAYQTVALPGFPNFFTLMGPHSPVGNFSLTAIAETQADYALRWMRRWQRAQFTAVAPRQDATDRYNSELKAQAPHTVWATGCTSWYLGKDGLPEIWPWHPDRHRELLSRCEDGDFEFSW